MLATGINTSKGEVISAIMNPPSIRFKFDEHMKLVMIALGLWGLVGFCCTILQMGLIGWSMGWVYGFYRLVSAVPILLPSVFIVAAAKGAHSLQALKVFCLAPPRIMLAGKVRVWCFDKTGTLTAPGLDFLGAQAVLAPSSSSAALDELTTDCQRWPDLFRSVMAVAHDLSCVDGGALVGSAVDLKMFAVSGWTMGRPGPQPAHAPPTPEKGGEAKSTSGVGSEPNHDDSLTCCRVGGGAPFVLPQTPTSWVHVASTQPADPLPYPAHEPKPSSLPRPPPPPTLCVLRRFAFDHAKMLMSAVVWNPHTRTRCLLVKGAYEAIALKCSTLPVGFLATTRALAAQGGYVLAMAWRDLPDACGPTSELMRDEVETELACVGLFVFRNQLKPDSHLAIAALKAGDVRPVMITGDNELTGAYIARACGMVRAD